MDDLAAQTEILNRAPIGFRREKTIDFELRLEFELDVRMRFPFPSLLTTVDLR
jgi:hypothetical protein